VAALLVFALLSPLLQAQPALGAEETLRRLGFTDPFLKPSETARRAPFDLEGLSISPLKANGVHYVRVSFEGADGFTGPPGHPSLPFKSYVFKVEGNVKDSVRVGLIDASARILTTHHKVLPALNPLSYLARSKQELRLEESGTAYSSDKFFPGRLLDCRAGYGVGGFTYVFVHLYPVQYNPLTGVLVVLDRAELGVSYSPAPKRSGRSGAAVIITAEGLKPAVEPLLELYGKLGVKAEIRTVEWIYEKYAEAEPIVKYPGFYVPPIMDQVYFKLLERYNSTLALRIVSYLRDRAEHPDLSHVTIVGDAALVPPSFYYFTFPGYPWDRWIPTDFFYSSPDYDLVPDYNVGRVPFGDLGGVARYVDKLRNWYQALGEGWVRRVSLSGGYPWFETLMFGESAISTASMMGYFEYFNVELLTRTGRNYNNVTVKALFSEGERIWYSSLVHGDGVSMIDALIADYRPRWEELVHRDELLALPWNSKVPVVSSVACMNAAWDDALLWDEQPFAPPSFGQSVLLSEGAGVAFMGSSRVAWELFYPPIFDMGLLSWDFAGASKLHLLFLKAYNDAMRREGNVTLGYLVSTGYVEYLAVALPVDEKIALETLFVTQLLGDPVLHLPTFEQPYLKEMVVRVEPLEHVAVLDPFILWFFARGGLPLYRADLVGRVGVEGIGREAEVSLVRFSQYRPALGWPLMWYELLLVDRVELVDGYAVYNITFSRAHSGYLLLKVRMGVREARFILLSAGLFLAPGETPQYGMVRIEGVGFDPACGSEPLAGLGVFPLMLYVAGWPVANIVPDFKGYFSWSLAPLHGVGVYNVTSFTNFFEMFTTLHVTESEATLAAERLRSAIDNAQKILESRVDEVREAVLDVSKTVSLLIDNAVSRVLAAISEAEHALAQNLRRALFEVREELVGKFEEGVARLDKSLGDVWIAVMLVGVLLGVESVLLGWVLHELRARQGRR